MQQSSVVTRLPVPAQTLRSPAQTLRAPERHLLFELTSIDKQIKVEPEGLGGLKIESDLFNGEVGGIACLIIAKAIEVRGGHDGTLQVKMTGIGEIKDTTSFSIMETSEKTPRPEIKPGGNSGTLKIRVAGILIEISGPNATFIPEP